MRLLFELIANSHEWVQKEEDGAVVAMTGIRVAAVVVIFFVMRTMHEMARYHAYLADFYYSRAQGLSLAIAQNEKLRADEIAAYSDIFMPPSFLYKISARVLKNSEDGERAKKE